VVGGGVGLSLLLWETYKGFDWDGGRRRWSALWNLYGLAAQVDKLKLVRGL